MENKGLQSKESSSYEDNFTQENDFLFEAGKKNNYNNCPSDGFTSTQQQKNAYYKMRKKPDTDMKSSEKDRIKMIEILMISRI